MELINPSDHPVIDGSTCSVDKEVPPGASMLRPHKGRWYCVACREYQDKPLMIRMGAATYPACLSCFWVELVEAKAELESGIEVPNVEEVEEISSVATSTADPGDLPYLPVS